MASTIDSKAEATISQIMVGRIDMTDVRQVSGAIVIMERQIQEVYQRVQAGGRPANEMMIDFAILQAMHAAAARLYQARYGL